MIKKFRQELTKHVRLGILGNKSKYQKNLKVHWGRSLVPSLISIDNTLIKKHKMLEVMLKQILKYFLLPSNLNNFHPFLLGNL